MKKVLKPLIVLIFSCSVVSAHGQPESPIGMTSFVTAIPTFATSEMSRAKTPQEKRKAKLMKFVDENLEQLQIEAAKGEGETLDTFASFYKIADMKAWRETVQESYEPIFFIGKTPKPSGGVYAYLDMLSRKFEP
jgi:hypothetical protein